MNSNNSNSLSGCECMRWEWKRTCFAPRPFQGGTAERRQHSTVHVHDRHLACLFSCVEKGSKGSAVTAVSFGFGSFLDARRGGSRPNSLRRACAI